MIAVTHPVRRCWCHGERRLHVGITAYYKSMKGGESLEILESAVSTISGHVCARSRF